MQLPTRTFTAFSRDRAGKVTVEQGLIAALIGVAIIAVVNSAGTEIKGTFTDVETGLKKRPKV